LGSCSLRHVLQVLRPRRSCTSFGKTVRRKCRLARPCSSGCTAATGGSQIGAPATMGSNIWCTGNCIGLTNKALHQGSVLKLHIAYSKRRLHAIPQEGAVYRVWGEGSDKLWASATGTGKVTQAAVVLCRADMSVLSRMLRSLSASLTQQPRSAAPTPPALCCRHQHPLVDE
jgi:hypothetical protein